MFRGVIDIASKLRDAPSFAYVPVKRALFIFDDAIAIALPNGLALLAQAAGMLVHHGVGTVAGAMLSADLHALKNESASFNPDFTVADLRSRVARISSVPPAAVKTARLSTAIYPVSQIGGVDLRFEFEGLEWDAAAEASQQRDAVQTLNYYKQHVRGDSTSAVALLTSVLADRVDDHRLRAPPEVARWLKSLNQNDAPRM